MSLRFRSELRLTLRMGSCQAELMAPGWGDRPAAVASGTGEGAAALGAALSALRLADIDDLPAHASLTVADEYVYYRLIEDDLGWAEALDAATAAFADDLGRADLRVQVVPVGGGASWIAAAVSEPDFAAWHDALSLAGVRIEHLHGALVEDLRLLAPQVPEDDAVIALLREQGMSLVKLRGGIPVALGWERFDASDALTMELRLRAFVRGTSKAAGPECVVYLLPESKALCRYVWGRTTRHHAQTAHGTDAPARLGQPALVPEDASRVSDGHPAPAKAATTEAAPAPAVDPIRPQQATVADKGIDTPRSAA